MEEGGWKRVVGSGWVEEGGWKWVDGRGWMMVLDLEDEWWRMVDGAKWMVDGIGGVGEGSDWKYSGLG